MPRIRSIKPEIHQDEVIGLLSDSGFRLFVGLITLADDLGRLKGDPTLIGAQIWPYRPKTAEQTDELLAELEQGGLIARYAHAGRQFVALTSWEKHQRIDNAGKTEIPSPEDADGHLSTVRGDSPRAAASRRDSPLDQGEDQGEERIKDQGVADDRADAPLSHLLADLIAQNGLRRPRVGRRWVEAERLLLTRDNRDPAEAERLIRWCQASEFWRSNVLSMAKFREKYDQLWLQAKRKPGGQSKADRIEANVHALREFAAGEPAIEGRAEEVSA